MTPQESQHKFQIGICFRPIAGDGVNFRNRKESEEQQLDFYYRNICVNFASIRQFDRDIPLLLFTTEPVPMPYVVILLGLEVKIEIVAQIYLTKPNFSTKYLGSLFILDCIAVQKIDTLYIDPDIVCITNIDKIIENENNIVVYDTYGKPECENGIKTIQNFLNESLLTQEKIDTYFGGEFYYIPKANLQEIREKIAFLWKTNDQAFQSGNTYLQTEEHILTLALRNMPNLQFTDSIQRIWTTRSYREVDPNFRSLTFLHLPAEKDSGFSNIYKEIFQNYSLPDFSILEIDKRESLFRMLHITQSLTQRICYTMYYILKKIRTLSQLQN